MKSSLVFVCIAVALSACQSFAADDLRETRNINREWKFFRGDVADGGSPALDDSAWEPVGLPHSFSIPYFLSKDFPIGYGWYRKRLDVPEDWLSKRVFVEFDGVFQDAEVFVNGTPVGGHKGGYTGFSVDITKALKAGQNVLAVRVNNLWNPRLAPRAGEHVFSGGIYRNVRLVVTDPLHVAWYGTTVTTPQVSAESATVNVKTEVVNSSDQPKSCTVANTVIDPDGRPLGEFFHAALTIAAGATQVFDQTSPAIPNPKLWHPDHPFLYSVRTTVLDGNRPVDSVTSPLGFRWFKWTADQGFFLNGEHYYFHGANVHQDHAGWGDAVTDAGAWRDVKLIKDAGFNFIRGSHYPHSPAFSDACDRLGVLLWSENCFWGTGGQQREGSWESSAYPPNAEDQPEFEASVKQTLRDMIRIHRNHPSVAIWSMTNEAFFTQQAEKAKALVRDEVALSHELDPTRAAASGGCQRGGFDKLGDVAGYNGDGARLFLDPGIPSVVSEYGSTISDRPGKYEPGFGDIAGQPPFAWRSGQVIWCGFDHGSIAGHFGCMGIVDYFRLPKRAWFWYRNEQKQIPPPEWPAPGTPARLGLAADKTTLRSTDGTDDAQIIVTVLDAAGKPVSNCPPVTLTIESGPGEFPTGPSITFAPDSDIAIRDGRAAIEFRSYHGGQSIIRATSPGLADATITITTEGLPAFTPADKPRPRPYARFVNTSARAAKTELLGRNNPTRTSSEAPDHSGRLANDGNPATFWQSAPTTGPSWWQVDLERLCNLTGAKWTSGAGTACQIEVSNDGTNWSPAGKLPATDQTTRKAEFPVDTKGRFVRISFPASETPVTLSEVEVFGYSGFP